MHEVSQILRADLLTKVEDEKPIRARADLKMARATPEVTESTAREEFAPPGIVRTELESFAEFRLDIAIDSVFS